MMSFVQFPLLKVAVGRKALSEVSDCLHPRVQWLRPLSERPYKKAGWDGVERTLDPRRGEEARYR